MIKALFAKEFFDKRVNLCLDKIMVKKLLVIIFALFAFFSFVSPVKADYPTTIYFFWGIGCPHCEDEKPFLERMEQKYPQLEVKMYETWRNQENAQLFEKMAQAYGTRAGGVPTTFIGDFEPIVGYADYLAPEIEEKIVYCLTQGCPDPIDKINGEKPKESQPICLHLFYAENCPQCENLRPFFQSLEQKYEIDFVKHNVNQEQEAELYEVFKEKYGLAAAAHPIVFIGERFFLGETAIRDYLEREIVFCQESGCSCPAEKIRGFTPFLPQATDVTPEEKTLITLPIVGEIDFSSMPLFLVTALIAFVDGFNPCSLWLITFLLGIVIYSGSKKKIFLVGITFLLVTTAAYGVFMVGLLNVFLYLGYLKWIQVIVAMVALTFAVVNIKDYFWYKKGLSFTISDKYKPKIFKDVRSIMKGDKSTWAMITGTAVMALGVVLVELPCTAGFPVIWTNILAQHHTRGLAFAFLFLLYLAIYLLDEIVVVLVATLTLKASRFEEKHGRILKLIGGMIMLALALIMLLKPELMNNILGTLLVFGSAVLASFILMFIHRRILPKYNIKIGTEESLLSPENDKKGGGHEEQ